MISKNEKLIKATIKRTIQRNTEKLYISYEDVRYHEFVGSTSVALQMTFTNIVIWEKLKMKKINNKKRSNLESSNFDI